AGRILNEERKPVVGAKVLVREVTRDPAARDYRSRSSKTCRGPLPGHLPQVTTAADGRFRLTGVGRDRLVTLVLAGPGISYKDLGVATRPSPAIPPSSEIHGPTFVYVAAPPRSVRGVVRDKATGKPVAGVKVSVEITGPTTWTDEAGRYQ